MSPYKLEPRSAASTSSSLSYTHAVERSDSDYHLMFPVVSDCNHCFLLQEISHLNKDTKIWLELGRYLKVLLSQLKTLFPGLMLLSKTISDDENWFMLHIITSLTAHWDPRSQWMITSEILFDNR